MQYFTLAYCGLVSKILKIMLATCPEGDSPWPDYVIHFIIQTISNADKWNEDGCPEGK